MKDIKEAYNQDSIKRLLGKPEKVERINGGCMNEKKLVIVCVVGLFFIAAASFGTGYYAGHRLSVRQAGQADNEFREQLEIKQARIRELEARLADVGIMVSDAFGNVSGVVDGVQRRIDNALQEAGGIRETVGIIRDAVKDLEDGKRYFRELAARLSGGELDFGE
jgi:hypothetical protein